MDVAHLQNGPLETVKARLGKRLWRDLEEMAAVRRRYVQPSLPHHEATTTIKKILNTNKICSMNAK